MEGLQQLIVDTDCGIDDFASLVFLKRRKVFPIAVTLCHGNVGMREARAAALLLFPSRIVFEGCSSPLVAGAARVAQWPGHGKDGLGDERERIAALLGSTEEDDQSNKAVHAASKIVDVCRAAADGSVSILGLGPLTNIALVCFGWCA